jgi:hypothetical protein
MSKEAGSISIPVESEKRMTFPLFAFRTDETK